MLRLARRAIPFGLLLVLLPQSSAFAATINVSMTNFMFTPKMANVAQNSTALWTNNAGATPHTSTSDTTMPIVWDSGTLNGGQTFSRVFTFAGKYTYHCSFHQGQGMVGTVSVPLRIQPPSGPVGTMFTVNLSPANPTGTLVFDVQKKNPGGNFQNWMLNVTTKSVVFNSTGLPTGQYQFRALLRDTSSGKKSGFSAAKGITVT